MRLTIISYCMNPYILLEHKLIKIRFLLCVLKLTYLKETQLVFWPKTTHLLELNELLKYYLNKLHVLLSWKCSGPRFQVFVIMIILIRHWLSFHDGVPHTNSMFKCDQSWFIIIMELKFLMNHLFIVSLKLNSCGISSKRGISLYVQLLDRPAIWPLSIVRPLDGPTWVKVDCIVPVSRSFFIDVKMGGMFEELLTYTFYSKRGRKNKSLC